ncbi:MAG: DUF4442 domain-containing protein [Bdellovibrio sp.]|nr:MAG: DUF4442 domain-containing protein [Bdellovibrio sp.]
MFNFAMFSLEKLNRTALEYTALVNGLSLARVPLLAVCAPQVVELTDERAVVKIRLDWRTRNHVGVMYFGALAMGAELSIALKAIQRIRESRKRIEFIFQDFQAEFLRRADGHVHFICDEAQKVAALIDRAASTEERLHETFRGFAIVPRSVGGAAQAGAASVGGAVQVGAASVGGAAREEPVMRYNLTLSVKNRSRKVS